MITQPLSNDYLIIKRKRKRKDKRKDKSGRKEVEQSEKSGLIKSEIEISERGIKFAKWFKNLSPESQKVTDNDLKKWAECYDKLIRIDKRDNSEIAKICKWARSDEFWQQNFRTPLKLRTRDKEGVLYYDVFLERMNKPKIEKQGIEFQGYNGL